jgi:hypothetical protein
VGGEREMERKGDGEGSAVTRGHLASMEVRGHCNLRKTRL